MKLALRGDFVPDAVNVQAAGPVADEVRPWIPLVSRLGTILTAVAGAVPAQVVVEVRGDLSTADTTILQLAAVRGIFGPVITEAVTFVNAPSLAAEHGLQLSGTSTAETGDYRSSVTLRAALADGTSRSVSGTLSGANQVAKLIEINDRHFDLRAEGDLLLVAYADRPGVMGTVGALLGDAGVNILAAQISPGDLRTGVDHGAAARSAADAGTPGGDRPGGVGERDPGDRPSVTFVARTRFFGHVAALPCAPFAPLPLRFAVPIRVGPGGEPDRCRSAATVASRRLCPLRLLRLADRGSGMPDRNGET